VRFAAAVAIAVVVIHGLVGYVLIKGLATSIPRQAHDRMTLITIAAERAPAPRRSPPARVSAASRPVVLHDWAAASPYQRNQDFIKTTQWVKDQLSEEERRFARWRATVPRGSGPGTVTRLRPPNLTTHTLYWPAAWSKGLLPIIAWGNGADNLCSNNSLPYAALLSDIASHGYFVVAVGNDDIDYPPLDGLEILADGRPIRTQTSALTNAVDWAIAENSRAGSPYEGKLDTGKIAYMGHACGGQQALAASSDPRTTTTVVLDAGDAYVAKARAAGWPKYQAALAGMSRDGTHRVPDRRWSQAVIAWLDWQLKGDSKAAIVVDGLGRDSWSRIDASGLQMR
jgi:hypothetical protein